MILWDYLKDISQRINCFLHQPAPSVKLSLMLAQPLQHCVSNQNNQLFWFGYYHCYKQLLFPASPSPLDPDTLLQCCALNSHASSPNPTPSHSPAIELPFPWGEFLSANLLSLLHVNLWWPLAPTSRGIKLPRLPTQWLMHPTILVP